MSDPSDQGPHPPLLDTKRHALFLDPDGTLFSFPGRPIAVESDVIVRALMRQLSQDLGGALAIISGRPIADVDRIFKGSIPLVAGLHGQELRYDAAVLRRNAYGSSQSAATFLGRFTASDERRFVEEKGAVLELPYRQAPEQKHPACAAAEAHGLKVGYGAEVVELASSAAPTTAALLTFMAQKEFTGRTPVVVSHGANNDLFSVALTLGGFGVAVRDCPDSGAKFNLKDEHATKSWLFKSVGLGD